MVTVRDFYARTFTDREVRENPELIEAAADYLRGYGGDFEPLVRAAMSNVPLSVPIARMVLNCMRHDVQAVLPSRGYMYPSPPMPARPKAEEKRKEPHLVWLGANRLGPYTYLFRLKGNYIANHNTQALWFHKIDHSKTTGIYSPPDWWRDQNSIKVQSVIGVCGKRINITNKLEMTKTFEEADAINSYCVRCKEAEND